MTYVTRHMDWLSFSIKTEDHPSVLFPVFEWRFRGIGKHGYRAKYECKNTHALCQQNSSNPDAGSAYQFSGDTLNRLRSDLGATDDGLVGLLSRNAARVSRIDLTINIHDGKLTPRDVQSAIKSGQAKAKSRVSRFIEGKDGDIEGDTYYIGSPTSDVQFRAYNKNAELGIVDGEAWLRLELEIRRARANAAFHSCASNGTDATVSGHMGDFLNWRNVEYQASLGQKSVPPIDIPRKATNRQRWLLGQVAQALAKEIAFDVDFKRQFDNSVDFFLDELKSTE